MYNNTNNNKDVSIAIVMVSLSLSICEIFAKQINCRGNVHDFDILQLEWIKVRYYYAIRQRTS